MSPDFRGPDSGAESFSVDTLLDAARQRTGLSDFGAPEFREGLEILVRSVISMSPSAKLVGEVSGLCVNALSNRLRVIDYATRHPEVRDEAIERPLFVLGMPRSGTTLASYLLDQDAGRRSLLQWESWDSVPPPTTATLRTDPRCLARLEAMNREIAADPDRLRAHVEFPDGPTECIRLHAQDFKALLYESPLPIPEYSRWIMQADLTSAYEYQRLVLQILQSQAPGVWSLKMPSHALHIQWLLKVFPDARIVWTHRDPYQALNSLFSMKSKRWQETTGDRHVEWLREHYVNQMAEHVGRALRVRAELGPGRVYDLHYADLVEDPIASMRALYDWAGDDFTPDTEQAMRAWLTENPQGRFGVHRYTLDEFGLSVEDLEPHFRDYLETVGVRTGATHV